MELAISTIITLFIALALLIILLVLIFNSSTTFKEKLVLFVGNSNVDMVVDSCNSNVNLQQNYDYCCSKRTVKVSKKEVFAASCQELALGNYSFANLIEKMDCEEACSNV